MEETQNVEEQQPHSTEESSEVAETSPDDVHQEAPAVAEQEEKSELTKVSAESALKTMDSLSKKETQQKRERGPRGLYPGRRKRSIAQVKVIKGSGKITINKRPLEEYFKSARYQNVVKSPLELLGQTDQLDVFVNVRGGGVTGQAEAILHGLARSLDSNFPDSHSKLRKAGFLTRDSRAVERKKYGLHKARRSPQFSKR